MYKGNLKQPLLAHWMPWFARDGKHCESGYISNNPYTIAAQIQTMRAEGIEGVIATYSGTSVDLQAALATREMAFQCSQQGMLFALLLNSSIVKFRPDPTVSPDVEVLHQLSDPITREILNCPTYIPEKYILEFDLATLGVDLTKINSVYSTYKVLSKHTGYSWPETNNTLSVLTKDNSNPTMMIPGVCGKFFDGGNPPTGVRDYSKSVWDKTANARKIEALAGQTYLSQLQLVPVSAKYIGIVTWNDYDEGTAIEGDSAMRSGILIK